MSEGAHPTWQHSYCLSCETRTNGETYCTERCRLAEWEGPALWPVIGTYTSSSSTTATTATTATTTPVSLINPPSLKRRSAFVLGPGYDFEQHRRRPSTTTITTTTSGTAAVLKPSLVSTGDKRGMTLPMGGNGRGGRLGTDSQQSLDAISDSNGPSSSTTASSLTSNLMEELRSYAMRFDFRRARTPIRLLAPWAGEQ